MWKNCLYTRRYKESKKRVTKKIERKANAERSNGKRLQIDFMEVIIDNE